VVNGEENEKDRVRIRFEGTEIYVEATGSRRLGRKRINRQTRVHEKGEVVDKVVH
tara:strand:- start:269 stop:433 length:165 start_codon:yes stop_codon:yes gene_type:complete